MYIQQESQPTPYELLNFLAGSFDCSITGSTFSISLFPGVIFDSGTVSLKFPAKFIKWCENRLEYVIELKVILNNFSKQLERINKFKIYNFVKS